MNSISDIKFPRVLIVGASPLKEIDATGITLVNLFLGWPIDRIAQIYDSEYKPDPRFCLKHWRFSSDNIQSVKVVKNILSRFRRRSLGNIPIAKDSLNVAPSSSISTGFLGALGDIVPFKLPKELLESVEEFKPDLIYSVLGSVRMMDIVLQLSKHFSIPVVPHFMDDWPETAYANSMINALPRLVLKYKLNSVLSRSAFGLTICEDMSIEFSRRYKKKFEHFMNCVEFSEIDERSMPRKSDVVKFGFTGGMHLNRWKSLISVAQVLQKLKNDGEQVSLEIYAPKKDLDIYRSLFDEYSVVKKMASLGAHEINEMLSSFNVLVHVESFNEDDSRYTKLSISTKIPQYMAAGRPILALGPVSISSIRYVVNTGAGLAVTSECDMSSLFEAVKLLIKSSELRAELGSVGKRIALEMHDAVKERIRFSTVLTKAKLLDIRN